MKYVRGRIFAPEIIYGKSAYEIAILHGYKGTEEEWLASLAEEANGIAMESAESAKDSETNAKESETNAKESETNAKESETNAKESADKARASETNAKSCEEQAKLHADQAKESETNAKKSADKARASETNAKSCEEQAKLHADQAKESETNAQKSADEAKASETKAKQYADEAKASDKSEYFDTVEHKSTNLLNLDAIEYGCYYWSDGRHDSSAYNSTPPMAVEVGQVLYLQSGITARVNRKVRFIVGYDENMQVVANQGEINFYTVPEGVAFVRMSATAAFLTAGNLSAVVDSPDGSTFEYTPWFEPYTKTSLKAEYHNDEHIQSVVERTISESQHNKSGLVYKFDINSDNHSTVEDLQDMFGYSIQFRGTVTAFDGLILAHGYQAYMTGYVKVTPTMLEYYLGTESTPRLSEAHGLTIKDYIAIKIDAKYVLKADITISTNGGVYKKTDQTWDVRTGNLSVRSYGENVLADCVLSYNCIGWSAPIQMYGDSYFGPYTDKWTRYLIDSGHMGHLQNGYPGRGSAKALIAAKTVLAHSNPEKIIWCLGMNDGDDSGVADASWLSCVEELMEICADRNIELILATIPNVPTVDNAAKNTYVRASGYRYIDFASAVGADADATWYSGMLSSDNVHPADLGAVALFNQAIADVPELMN